MKNKKDKKAEEKKRLEEWEELERQQEWERRKSEMIHGRLHEWPVSMHRPSSNT